MAKKTFREWWESEAVKTAVNTVYSLGASVVIIGALFKIMHFPGAGIVLSIGMLTEAFLFSLSAFDKVHVEYKWEHIFPALLAKEAAPLTSYGASTVGGAQNSLLTSGAPAAPAQEMSALTKDQVSKLDNGIKRLAETADSLADLGGVVDSSAKLQKNMELASDAAAKFAGSQGNLATATTGLGDAYQAIIADMGAAVQSTKNYGANIAAVNQQMSSINSAYELQLKNIQAQAQIYGTQSEKINGLSANIEGIVNDLAKLQKATAGSVAAAQKYTENSEKLAAQIADLNKVYGNMLNALG